MAGYPGSGKSTLARKIAQKVKCVVVDRDVIKTAMIQSKVPNDIINTSSYKVLFDLANSFLDMGMSVIIDTPCYYDESLMNGQEIAKIHEVKYKYIECRVEDYSIIEERVLTRRRLLSQISDTSPERFAKAINKSVKPTVSDFLIVDTTSEDSYDMNKIVEYISN